MKTISKALVGTVAAGAMAMAAATPAMANDRYDDDDIDAGEIIAGALIIGGIAAIAGSIGNDRDGRYYDRRGYNTGYYRNNARQAVQQCVNTAQRTANRYSRGRARVTDVRDIDRKRGGYRVKGTIVVNERNRGWGRDYSYRYGGRDYDRGRFTCDIRYGRVVDIDYDNIRGLG